MKNDGADLTKPHAIDFHIAVKDEKSANLIMKSVIPLGFKVEVIKDEDGPGWTCWCTKTIIPKHSTIISIEEQLDSIAREFDGWADGWGTFAVS